MSLFEGLSIANRGLAASQMALNVTGQNISNANTVGYSRKKLELSADYRADGEFGQMGFGVDVNMIQRVRNVFLDRQLSSQITSKAYTEEKDAALERIENIHQEPSDKGIASSMDDFWNAWSDLANNPGDKSSREVLASSAQVMVDRFHYTSDEIRSYKLSINDQILDNTTQINDLASKISEMNKTIVASEGLDGQKANDSRDIRDTLLQKLADITDITAVEDASGAVTVTTAGSMLVTPNKAIKLETVRVTVTEPDGFKYPNYTVRFEGAENPLEPKNGRLKALMDIRDKIIPSYENELNGMVSSLVKEVNAVHSTGYSLNHLTGIDFFDGTKLTASNISLSAAVQSDSNNIAASQGGTIKSISGQVIPSDAANVLDLPSINPAYRDLAVGSVKVMDQATGRVLEEGAEKDYVMDTELGRIKIMNTTTYPAGTNFVVDFHYNTTGFSGTGDGNNALAISTIRDKKTMDPDINGVNSHTVSEYFSGYIGRLGVERNQASSELDTQTALVEQLQGQQDSISGVNLDEEMANLIRYQQTYQASAKYMTTIGNMLDVLMKI